MRRQLAGAVGSLVAKLDVDLDETAWRDRAAEVDGCIALVTDVAVIDVHIVTVAAVAAALLGIINTLQLPSCAAVARAPNDVGKSNKDKNRTKNRKNRMSNKMPLVTNPLFHADFQ